MVWGINIKFLIKLLSIVLVSVLIALVVGGCDTKDKMSAPTQITVTDMAGRQVSVTVPVKKVVLGCAKDLPTFAVVAGEDFPRKIAGWGATAVRPSAWDQGIFLKYKEKYPEIEAISDVGSHAQGTFSVEKVISLKPDVVIFPLWLLLNEYPSVAEDIARMEGVGIPTVFIDFGDKPLENTIPSTLLLGTLLGKEERAKEIMNFFQKQVNEVVSRMQKIKKPKFKVYLEAGGKGPSGYGSTCGNHSWCGFVVKAGGINIAEGIIKRWGQINPEYLLKTNPDVIIIVGLEPPSSMRFGYPVNPEESRQVLKAYTERPGWNNLSAVKNGRVYGVFNNYLIFNIYNFAVIEAISKWFYPDEFKDLDPEANLREFHKKFFPVNYSGVWMIGIQD
jgi:iron complex transport system substrate-binding protein